MNELYQILCGYLPLVELELIPDVISNEEELEEVSEEELSGH